MSKQETSEAAETIFTLRMPNELRDKVDADAKIEHRSRHAQILKILRDHYAQQPETLAQANQV